MKEENRTENPEEKEGGAPAPSGKDGEAEKPAAADLGKFKSVDALMRAYKELEAEFTRRSQKLKALEEAAPPASGQAAPVGGAAVDLYEEVKKDEGVRARIVSDYLSSLKGVPLMTGAGVGVSAPVSRVKSIKDAGGLALGYLRNQKK